MRLQMWSTDSDGQMHPDDESEVIEVAGFDEATAKLVEDLYHTASDEFLTRALTVWFAEGVIVQLPAGNNVFWNVRLLQD